MNVRLDKLACKTLNNMKHKYYVTKNSPTDVTYKYSDFELEGEPIRTKRKSLAAKIEKHILKPRKHKSFIREERPWENWQPPPPIFTYTGKQTPMPHD